MGKRGGVSVRVIERACKISAEYPMLKIIMVTIFFFKQNTAYEILSGLVGSEMCIRVRFYSCTK